VREDAGARVEVRRDLDDVAGPEAPDRLPRLPVGTDISLSNARGRLTSAQAGEHRLILKLVSWA